MKKQQGQTENSAPMAETVADFLKWCGKNRTETMLYRGLASVDWKISASLHRRLEANYGKDEVSGNAGFFNGVFVREIEHLIKLAQDEGHGGGQKGGANLNDVDLLVELQHFGAATCLVDFTQNPLVALWFACQPVKGGEDGKAADGDDGKIAALSAEGMLGFDSGEKIGNLLNQCIGEKSLRKFSPKKQNNRIVAQQSVFVFGMPVIAGGMSFCRIAAGSKKAILRELRDLGISAESLFCDFTGFAEVNGSEALYHRADKYLNLAQEYYRKQEWKKAAEWCGKAIALNDRNAVYYFVRGNANIGLGDYRAAVRDFDAGIKLDGNNATAYNNRGVSKVGLREYKAAIGDYDTAINFNPGDANTYNNRGTAKICLGQYEAAIEDYGEAVNLNKNYAEAYYHRGNAKYFSGDKAGARADFEQAQKLAPKEYPFPAWFEEDK